MIIIALTGWGQENDKARSSEAGCSDHLVKPIDLAALEKILTKHQKDREDTHRQSPAATKAPQ